MFQGISLSIYIRELYILVLLTLIRSIATIDDKSGVHQVSKRMDLELCLDQFDVHRDTIIRTEESLSIGGKYLQGLNIETLKQCQHLCCETDSCDVFIFEGKNGGYCYLFECGPPENFRCKFTRHSNYTSAVLTPIHRTLQTTTTTITPPTSPLPSVQLQSQLISQPISLSQHELELSNLKQKPESNAVAGNSQKSTLAPITSASASSQALGNPVAGTQTGSTCRRFQFQCHSGECIAVYNACDGIPQCEDGSDEGPECPSNSGVAGKSSSQTGKLEEIPNLGTKQGSKTEMVDAISQQTELQSAAKTYQLPSNINNREDPMSAPPIWTNRKVPDSQDIEHNSKIFNHKGGIQITGRNLPPPYQNPIPNLYNNIPRDMYMQPDYQLPYRGPIIRPQDHLIDQQSINWQQQQMLQQRQQQQPMLTAGSPYISSVNGQPVPQIHAPIIKEQAIPINQPAVSVNPQQQAAPQTDSGKVAGVNEKSGSTKGKSNHEDNAKNNSNESEEYDEYEEKSTEPPKKKQRKHKKPSNKSEKVKNPSNNAKTEKPIDAPLHEQLKMIKDSMEIEFLDHDGQSERPGGAVLSLTLGIIVTAALAVLVGCRMRTVTRRSRRLGKTPYAHDADFLVNGMYL